MKPKYLVIHCSATNRSTTTVKSMRDYHVNVNGWADIGYHKVIDIAGKVHQGRPDHIPGAHEPFYNKHSLGICLIGNFDVDVLSEEDPQFKALVQVCATLAKRHGIDPENIVGHRDAWLSRGLKPKKSCPGKTAYALLPRLRELVAAYLD